MCIPEYRTRPARARRPGVDHTLRPVRSCRCAVFTSLPTRTTPHSSDIHYLKPMACLAVLGNWAIDSDPAQPLSFFFFVCCPVFSPSLSPVISPDSLHPFSRWAGLKARCYYAFPLLHLSYRERIMEAVAGRSAVRATSSASYRRLTRCGRVSDPPTVSDQTKLWAGF